MAKQLIYQFDISGTTRTFNFGMYCWEIFCEKMDVDPTDLLSVFQGKQTFKALRLVAYCGIVANDYLKAMPDSVTEQQVTAWLNAEPEIIGQIFAVAVATFYDIDAARLDAAADPKPDDAPASQGDKSKKKRSRSARSKR